MTTATEAPVCLIAHTLIEPDPAQPRKSFDDPKVQEHIAGLARSIRSEGLLQPITVRPHPEVEGRFIIVAGECRWRAHVAGNIPLVRCLTTTSLEDARRRGRAQLLENMGRRDMTLREEAFGVERQVSLGDTEDEVADSLGLTKSRVGVLRRLTKLSEAVWGLIEKGALAPATVEAAVGKIPERDVEGVLFRCAGKNVNQAAVILYDYHLEQRQESFALALEEAGVGHKKGSIGQALARQLLQIAADVEKLTPADRTDFARLVGNDVAAAVAHSKRNKAGASFITAVFTRVHVVMEPDA